MKVAEPAARPVDSNDVKIEQSKEKPRQNSESIPKEVKRESSEYKNWKSVVARIGELKASLSVQFAGSSCTVDEVGCYIIRMNAFFAKSLSSSERDLSIVRGVIAEREGIAADSVNVRITSENAPSGNAIQNELFNTIDNF